MGFRARNVPVAEWSPVVARASSPAARKPAGFVGLRRATGGLRHGASSSIRRGCVAQRTGRRRSGCNRTLPQWAESRRLRPREGAVPPAPGLSSHLLPIARAPGFSLALPVPAIILARLSGWRPPVAGTRLEAFATGRCQGAEGAFANWRSSAGLAQRRHD
jgi:hypothetical protein